MRKKLIDRVKNLQEAKDLVKRYLQISLDEDTTIEKTVADLGINTDRVADGEEILGHITGFGKISSCTLCFVIGKKYSESAFKCPGCIWYETNTHKDETQYSCINKSYNAIHKIRAESSEEIIHALKTVVKTRAEALQKKIDKVEGVK